MPTTRAFLFYLLHWPLTFILSIIIISVRPFGIRASYSFGVLWSRINLFLLRHICGLDLKVIKKGTQPEGPAVYISNHQSAWETIAYPAVFPPFMWVLKRELFMIPLFGWCLRCLGHIGIERELGLKSIRKINEAGLNVIENGFNVIIFPEGTRMSPDILGDFNPGGVGLALKAGVPIVPVTHNAGIFWRRKELAKRPGTITIIIDEPISTEGISGPERKGLNNKIRDIIAGRLEEINGDGNPLSGCPPEASGHDGLKEHWNCDERGRP